MTLWLEMVQLSQLRLLILFRSHSVNRQVYIRVKCDTDGRCGSDFIN